MNAYVIRSRLDLFSNFTLPLTHPIDLDDPINGDQFEQAERRTVTRPDAVRSWVGAAGRRLR